MSGELKSLGKEWIAYIKTTLWTSVEEHDSFRELVSFVLLQHEVWVWEHQKIVRSEFKRKKAVDSNQTGKSGDYCRLAFGLFYIHEVQHNVEKWSEGRIFKTELKCFCFEQNTWTKSCYFQGIEFCLF